jgi:hypothetical protein
MKPRIPDRRAREGNIGTPVAQWLPATIAVSRMVTAAGEGSERDDLEGFKRRWDDDRIGSSAGGSGDLGSSKSSGGSEEDGGGIGRLLGSGGWRLRRRLTQI